MGIKKGLQEKKETAAKRAIKSAEGVAEKIEAIIDSKDIVPSDLTPLSNQLEKLPIDNILISKCREKGLTEDRVAEWLLELFNWKSTRFDKNGNVIEEIDGNLRLKAMEIWCKISGNTGKESVGTTHNHLHLEKLSDDKLADLARKANKCRTDKADS